MRSIDAAFVLAALVACKTSPKTSGELIKGDSKVLASVTGVKTAIAAIRKNLDVPAGAKCERAGLTFATKEPVVEGNAEVLWVDSTRDYDIASSTRTGPLGWITSLGESAEAGVARPHMERARATAQVLIIRELSSTNADVFLVDLPAGTISCATKITSAAIVEAPHYDPETGDRPKGDRATSLDEADAKFRTIFEAELAKRFGLPARSGPAAPSKTVVAAKARYGAMVRGLADAMPACTDPEPAGALRTTTLRLNVYAGNPLLAETDLNYRVELEEWISPKLRDYVDASKAADRDKLADELAAAPATSVLDIPKGKLGSFAIEAGGLESKTFHPGKLTARIVRFDASGKATCQAVKELTNPAELTITYNGMDYTKALAVEEASIADFKKQLAAGLAKL